MVEVEKFKNLTKEWEVREKYIAFDKVKVCAVAFHSERLVLDEWLFGSDELVKWEERQKNKQKL